MPSCLASLNPEWFNFLLPAYTGFPGKVTTQWVSLFAVTSFPAVRCYANLQKERLQEDENWSWAEAESANVRTCLLYTSDAADE